MQWICLVALSVALAALLLWLHAPAALMLGPLLAAIAFSVGNGKVKMPLAPFVVAQGVVGSMIAKMIPLSIAGDILNHWALFTFGVLAVVIVSAFIGWLMTRLQMLPGTTALWGTSPGAASVMTIMSESYGADMRLVAFMQYLRIVLVAAAAALVARIFGVNPEHHVAPEMVWFPPVDWLAFGETMAIAVLGPVIAQRLNIPAGAFLVPMIVGIVLTHFGLMTIELPPWLLAGVLRLHRLEHRASLHPRAADLRPEAPAANPRLHRGDDWPVRPRRRPAGLRRGHRPPDGLSRHEPRRFRSRSPSSPPPAMPMSPS